jgi:branched-chain amino acid transport system ATP-binding protein
VTGDGTQPAGLTIRGVVAGYGGSIVLSGVDLTVPAGGVVALLGRNGAGKSTLVNTIMGLVKAREGSILLDDRELAGRAPDVVARTGVGLVPQGRRIFGSLTVAEHLALSARIGRHRPAGSDGWTIDRIVDLLPRLGERLGHRGHQLSGGEQQMLAIARALLTRPRLLLLDEPSDGLAPTLVNQIGEVVTTLAAGGITTLLVEQNLRLAFTVADRVAVLAKGQVVLDTTTADFRSDAARANTLLGVG